MTRFAFRLEWPGGGHDFVRECADATAAEAHARYKARKHRDAKWTVTEVPADKAANDSSLADTGPWPTPAGPSLEHAFAPGSREFFAACDADARAIVREGSAKGDAWLGGGL